MVDRIKTRLASLVRRERLERDLDRELLFHIDMLTEQHVRAGMAPGAARQAAMRTFGVVDRVKDDVHRARALLVARAVGQREGCLVRRRQPRDGREDEVVEFAALGQRPGEGVEVVSYLVRHRAKLALRQRDRSVSRIDVERPEVLSFRALSRAHELNGAGRGAARAAGRHGRPWLGVERPDRVGDGGGNGLGLDLVGDAPRPLRVAQRRQDVVSAVGPPGGRESARR